MNDKDYSEPQIDDEESFRAFEEQDGDQGNEVTHVDMHLC